MGNLLTRCCVAPNSGNTELFSGATLHAAGAFAWSRVALASDLLLAARVLYGRPLAATSDSGMAGQGPANGVRSPLVSPGDLPALDQPELANANQRLAGAVREATGR